MNLYLQKHTTYQFTCYIFIYFKTNSKIQNYKIQQVHQKLQTKQFLLLYLNCFLFVIHLNLKHVI